MNYNQLEWAVLENLYEEQSVILENFEGYSRYEAEQLSAQMHGFSNKSELKIHIQELKSKEK